MSLKLVSATQIKQISQEPGIYYLLNESKITYIGHSKTNMQARIRSHINAGRQFSQVSWAILNEQVSPACLQSIERALIQYWRPPENKRFKIQLPGRVNELPSLDFITIQNQHLNARIIELEQKLAALERVRRIPQKLKLSRQRWKSRSTNEMLSPPLGFAYLGGIVFLNGKEIILQCSNMVRPIPPGKQTEDLPDLVKEPEQPKLYALPAIIPKSSEPTAKILSFKQKMKAGLSALWKQVIGKG